MSTAFESITSSSLLLRVRSLDDDQAWTDFVHRYTPKIYGWCRRYDLQESDAADVAQNVMRKLVGAMRAFEYDPDRGSFRGWLKTVTNNAVRDFLRSLRPDRGSGDSQLQKQLAAIQAPEAVESLSRTLEEEAERELVREAEARVRVRVRQRTWKAYALSACEHQKATAIAKQLDMPIAEVYRCKSRVIKMLQAEIRKLGGFDPN